MMKVNIIVFFVPACFYFQMKRALGLVSPGCGGELERFLLAGARGKKGYDKKSYYTYARKRRFKSNARANTVVFD